MVKNTEKSNEEIKEELRNNPSLLIEYIKYLMDNNKTYRRKVLKKGYPKEYKAAIEEWTEEATDEFKYQWIRENIVTENSASGWIDRMASDMAFLVGSIKASGYRETKQMLKEMEEAKKNKENE